MKKLTHGIQGKFVLLFSVLTLLLISAIGYATYKLSFKQVETQYENLAKSTVEMAAELVNGDSIAGYLANGKDTEYEAVYKMLQNLKINYGLKYLYVFIPDTTENNAVYIFDIYKDGDNSALVASLGESTGYIDTYDLAIELYTTGHSDHPTVITNGEYGYLASAYAPILSSAGKPVAIVGADIEMNVIIGEVKSHTAQILFIAVGIILVFIIILLIIINRQMILPITGLSAHMERFARDSEHLSDEPFIANTGDEIEKMAASFNSMVVDIRKYIENLSAVTADRERIATELNVAKQIQASMLPSIFPAFPDRQEFDIFAVMEPAKEVGGDFYDFFMIDDKRMGVVIADVSGKGVPAALFMVITKTLIKNQAGFSATPSDILEVVNDKLLEANDAALFVTVFIGILEIDTGRFTYSNAGHNPPLIARNGGSYEFLKVDSGFVLAGWEGFRYKTAELFFKPGDRLVMYTDGVTEALNPDEELFGESRLMETLNEPSSSSIPLEELVHKIRNSISIFESGTQQADDITIMALSFNEKSSQKDH